MTMRTYTVREMVERQDALNEEVCSYTGLPWHQFLTDDMLMTQIHAELGEFLNETGVTYKWWKKPNGKLDHFAVKMEIIDIFHFYLGRWTLASLDRGGSVELAPEVEVETVTTTYNRGDERPFIKDDGNLDHQAFNEFVYELAGYNIYKVIDMMVSGGRMTPDEFCALYAAKSTLNSVRVSAGYREGKYTNKPADGTEDSKRLEYIIDAFMHEESFTLDQVCSAVMEEFFEVNDDGEKEKAS